MKYPITLYIQEWNGGRAYCFEVFRCLLRVSCHPLPKKWTHYTATLSQHIRPPSPSTLTPL